jgi:hypothetical protein
MTVEFRDFLLQQAEKHRAEIQAGKTTVDEWRAALERLFAQIRTWLQESDSQGIIEIEETQHDVTEPGLGRYRVPRLDLRAFGKWVGIIPKARKTVGVAQPRGRLVRLRFSLPCGRRFPMGVSEETSQELSISIATWVACTAQGCCWSESIEETEAVNPLTDPSEGSDKLLRVCPRCMTETYFVLYRAYVC